MAFEQVGVQAVVQGLQQFLGDLQTMETKTQSFGTRLGSIGSAAKLALGAAVGGGLGLILGDLGKRSVDLDNAMHQLAATTGMEQAAADKLKPSIIALSKAHLDTQTQIAATMQNLIQLQGVEGTNVPLVSSLTDKYLAYARATGQEAAGAVSSFRDVLNAWNLTAKDGPAIMDKLIYSQEHFGLSATESQAALKTFAPTFQALGMNVDQAVGYMNMFQKAGVDAGSTGMAFNKAVTVLTDATAKGTKNLETMAGKMHLTGDETKRLLDMNPAERFQFLTDKIGGMVDPAARAEAAIALFGARGGTKMAQALQEGGGSIDKFKVSMDQAGGAAQAASDKIEGSFTNKIKILTNTVLGTLQEKLTPIAPLLMLLGVAGPVAAGGIAAVGGAMLALALNPVGLTIIAIVGALALLELKTHVLSEVVLPALLSAFSATFGFVKDTIIPWLETKAIPAMEKLGKEVIAQYLIPAFTTLKDGAVQLWPVIQQIGATMLSLGDTIGTAVLPVLKTIGEYIIEHKPLWMGLAIVVGLAAAPFLVVAAAGIVVLAKWQEIKQGIKDLIDDVTNMQVIGPIVQAVWNTIAIGTTTAWHLIYDYVKVGVDTVRGVIKVVMDLIHGDWSQAWSDLKAIPVAVFHDLETLVKNAAHGFLAAIANILADMIQQVKDATDFSIPLIGNINPAAGAMQKMVNKLRSVAASGASGLYTDGTNLGQQFASGVDDMGPMSYAAGKRLRDAARAGTSGNLFTGFGGAVQSGLQAIKDQIAAAKAMMPSGGGAGPAADPTAGAWDQAAIPGKASAGAKAAVKATVDELVAAFREGMSDTTVLNQIGQAGVGLMQALDTAIKDGTTASAKSAGDAGGKIVDSLMKSKLVTTQQATDFGSQLTDALAQAIQTGSPDAEQAVQDLLAKINTALMPIPETVAAAFNKALAGDATTSDLVKRMGTTGAALVNSLTDAITNGSTTAAVTAAQSAQTLIDSMAGKLKPDVAAKLGSDLMAAVANAITLGTPEAIAAVQTAAQAIQDALFPAAKSVAQSFADSLASASADAKLQDKVGSAGKNLVDALTKAINGDTTAATAAGQLAQGIITSLQAADPSAAGALGTQLTTLLTIAIQTGTPAAVQAVIDLLTQVNTAVTTGGAIVLSSVDSFDKQVSDLLAGKALQDKVGANGKSLMDALNLEISSGGKQGLAAMSTQAFNIIDAMKAKLSPSVSGKLGDELMGALQTAITTGGTDAVAKVQAILKQINDLMTAPVPTPAAVTPSTAPARTTTGGQGPQPVPASVNLYDVLMQKMGGIGVLNALGSWNTLMSQVAPYITGDLINMNMSGFHAYLKSQGLSFQFGGRVPGSPGGGGVLIEAHPGETVVPADQQGQHVNPRPAETPSGMAWSLDGNGVWVLHSIDTGLLVQPVPPRPAQTPSGYVWSLYEGQWVLHSVDSNAPGPVAGKDPLPAVTPAGSAWTWWDGQWILHTIDTAAPVTAGPPMKTPPRPAKTPSGEVWGLVDNHWVLHSTSGDPNAAAATSPTWFEAVGGNSAFAAIVAKALGEDVNKLNFSPIVDVIDALNKFGTPEALRNAVGLAGSYSYGFDQLLPVLRPLGLLFDKGGWLMPGMTLARNDTGMPERVSSPADMYAQAVGASVAGQQVMHTKIDVNAPFNIVLQNIDWAQIKDCVHTEVDVALGRARSETIRSGVTQRQGVG